MSFITSPGVIVPPLTAGGVAYGTGSQAKVNSAGTSGQVLVSGGAGVPTFSNPSTVAVTSFSGASTGLTPATPTTGAVSLAGTLAVGNGGTSLTTLTANNVILGNGASAPTFVAPGATNNVLLSNGSTWTSSTPATLTVDKGGTSLTSLTANNVILGNGTLAPQFVSPGASGNVLTSNGSTWQSTGVSASALVFLSLVTASSSATVDIENTFNSTYDAYLIVASGITFSASSQNLLAQMKLGGSYLAGTGYSYHSQYTDSGSILYVATASTADSSFFVAYGTSSTAGESCSFNMHIYNPSSTTIKKMANWSGGIFSVSSKHTNIFGSGHNTSTSALTGIRFSATSGNITGNFRLYGIANS